jgi:hypothetical protein
MATDPENSTVPPSQTTGGNAPDADEVAQKPDPELGSSVLGQTTGSDEPATASGVDPSAGDDTDATTSGGANLPDGEDVEPSIRHTAMNAMQTVRDYAKTKAV